MIHHSPRRAQGWIRRSDLLIEVCRGVAWGGSKCKVDKSLHSWGWMLGLGLVSLVCILTPELTVLAWYVTGGLTSLSSASNSWSPHQLPPPPTLPPPPPPPPPTALTAGNALRVINILSLANCPCQWSRNYIVCHRKQYSDIWLGPSVKWSSWKAFKILISLVVFVRLGAWYFLYEIIILIIKRSILLIVSIEMSSLFRQKNLSYFFKNVKF